MGMMIEVRDYFEKNRWDSIDFYTSTLADVPLSLKTSPSVITVTKRFTSLFKYNSSLVIKAKVRKSKSKSKAFKPHN
jgi:hypothetical protein